MTQIPQNKQGCSIIFWIIAIGLIFAPKFTGIVLGTLLLMFVLWIIYIFIYNAVIFIYRLCTKQQVFDDFIVQQHQDKHNYLIDLTIVIICTLLFFIGLFTVPDFTFLALVVGLCVCLCIGGLLIMAFVGVLIYEAVTGKKVFKHKERMFRDDDDLYKFNANNQDKFSQYYQEQRQKEKDPDWGKTDFQKFAERMRKQQQQWKEFEQAFQQKYQEERQQQQSQSTSKKTEYAEILGIAENANKEEIETAYRRKMKDFHPDKNPKVTPAVEQMLKEKSQQINKARDYLMEHASS